MNTTANFTPITAAEHNLALTIERRKDARTVQHMVDNVVRAHAEHGCEVLVKGGVIFCQDHGQALDASGSRPGLIASNQVR